MTGHVPDKAKTQAGASGKQVTDMPSLTNIEAGDNLETWLGKLSLDKYAEVFRSNDIDRRALRHLGDADLRELGVSLGHRKIMLAAIAALETGTVDPINASDAPLPDEGYPSPHARKEQSAERRLVSVLFCDLVGSTVLAQRLDPEHMRDQLSGYQERVAGAIKRYGGHVAHYLGDGVMAIFGWPMAHEDQAERAVLAGLEALAAVQALEAPGGARLQARVGVASGGVVVGHLSGVGRQDGNIAGQTPNLAARLQACADANQLVISEETRKLIGEAFDIEDLGSRSVKGFESETRLYRVIRTRQLDSRFDATHVKALSPFVGRVHELALLLERWDLSKAGEGQAVLISGEAGIGKSRLVRALADRLKNEPHVVWRLQCSPYHTSSALFPLTENLRRALGYRAEDTVQERWEKLERMLAETGEDARVVAPIYAEMLSLDSAGRYAKLELTPPELKRLIVGTLIDRCLRTAAKSPLLLIVEDAHWIDPTTRELIEQTILRIANARVLVIITHRPEWKTEWASAYGHVLPISLGRLAKPQIAELIVGVAAGRASDQLVANIAARTDGVPLFIEEVTRSLFESGAETRAEAFEIPWTLHGSLMARLDRLPATAKELIQAASVIGREFTAEVLARVSQRSRADVDAALDDLVAARLILKGGMAVDALSFRHALIQDAAYQSLLRSKLASYHEAIARTLIEFQPDMAQTQPELVAHHFTAAGLADRAVPFWRQAGERAVARSANNEAVVHFEKAAELCGQLADPNDRDRILLATRISLGGALVHAGRLQEAKATFVLAAQHARQQGDTQALVECALWVEGLQMTSNEPHDLSIELLTEALSLTADPGGRDGCRLLSRLTRAYYMTGNFARADELAFRTVELARNLHDDDSLCSLLISGLMAPRGGLSHQQMVEKCEQMDEVLRIAGRLDDKVHTATAFSVDLYFSLELGERARIVRRLDEFASSTQVGQRLAHQWIVRHAKAMFSILEGDFAGAERLAEEALDLGRQSAGERVEGIYGMQMFTIRREQGRLAEVAPVIKRFVDENPDEPAWRPGLALIACDLGFKEAAQRMLLQQVETASALPIDAKRSTTLAFLAEVCASLDDAACAEVLYGMLDPYRDMTVTAGVATLCLGSAGRYLGMLAGVLGAWDRAEQHFEEALRMNRDLQAWPWLAHTQREFAHMLHRRAREADIVRAHALLGEAWATASRFDMAALRSKLRGQLN